ncbi:MAG: hypothetical protein K9K32_04565 [Halanaerobiales bacterium]|nr:hypothetical protein [Halanaerobiales bacterium]
MIKIKIFKDDWKDDDTVPSIESMVGKVVEAEKIDKQGYAIVEHPLGGKTDIYPNEYELMPNNKK